MNDHAERIRRIQALVAQLDTALTESNQVQEAAASLHAEAAALLNALRRRERTAGKARPAAPVGVRRGT